MRKKYKSFEYIIKGSFVRVHKLISSSFACCSRNFFEIFSEYLMLVIFPPIEIQDISFKQNNGNKNWLSIGMLATKNNPNDIKVNIRDVFETIPDNVTEEDF